MNKNILVVILILWGMIRLIESIYPDKKKIPGKVSSKWVFFCLLINGPLVYIFCWVEFLMNPKPINWFISIIGITLLLMKMFIKIWVLKTMGKLWSVQIEIRENHKLITTGPYKYVRHPGYLSTIMEMTGGPLIVNAYLTLAFAWIAYIPFLFIRIYLEEEELKKKLKKEYENYKKSVPPLIPLIKI